MPTNRELEIIMRLKDEVTKRLKGVEGAIQKFANRARETGQTLKQLGRDISQVGQNLIFMGGALTGPLALAFKSAEKYSIPVYNELKRLDNAFIGLRVSIAEALIPVVHKLANVFGNLLNLWNSIDPATRNLIIQSVAMTGIFMMLGGVVIALVGRLVRLSGTIASLVSKLALFTLAHPWIAALVVIVVALTYVFLRFRTVAVPVLNAVEIGANMVYIGFTKLFKGLIWGFDFVLQYLVKFYDVLGKLPGKLGEPFRTTSENLKKLREELALLTKASDIEIARSQEKISKIMSEGEGSLVKGYDKAKASIQGFIATFKGLGKETKIEEIAQSFNAIEAIGQGTARSLGESFSHLFKDAFRGEIDSAKDYFVEFGNMMIDVLAEVLAKIVLIKTIGAVFPGMIPYFHQGGVVRPVYAHSGYLAHDEVPIIAQAGEGVISRRGMSRLGPDGLRRLNQGDGAGDQNQVFNIYIAANDAKSFRDMLMQHPDVMEDAISSAIAKNRSIRSTIRNNV